MPLARLVFYPENTRDLPPDAAAIINALSDIGLTGDAWQNNVFLPGRAFIELLTFLGCAPSIRLHPDDGDGFCYIVINASTATPVNLGHSATVIPRCPACRHKILDWKDIPNWQQAATRYTCEQCGTEHTMDRLQWRHESGYGRFSLAIAQVHPHEAVPSEQLLSALETASGFRWNYCYATD